MYPFIVCFCGRSLGDIYDLFKALRTQKYIEAYGTTDIDPTILAICEDVEVDLSDVLDQLHLHTKCCRTHIATQVEFKDFY